MTDGDEIQGGKAFQDGERQNGRQCVLWFGHSKIWKIDV